jgi:hypothetical protein
MFGKRNPNRNGSPPLSEHFVLDRVSEPSVGTMTIAATSKIRKSGGAIVLALRSDAQALVNGSEKRLLLALR